MEHLYLKTIEYLEHREGRKNGGKKKTAGHHIYCVWLDRGTSCIYTINDDVVRYFYR